ncbi:MAG: hypothetical protein AB7U82_03790 [Blastocatellales bacterium]
MKAALRQFGRQFGANLPQLCLTLIFLAGWLAAPLSLMAPEPVTCEMAHCQDEGYCCCAAARLSRLRDLHEPEKPHQLFKVNKGCSSCCALPSSSSGQLKQTRAASSYSDVEPPKEPAICRDRSPLIASRIFYQDSSPRSPPFLLINFSIRPSV